MQSVEISINPPELADTLNAMREWLDQRKASANSFRTTRDIERDVVIVRAEFDDDDIAAAFHKRFSSPTT